MTASDAIQYGTSLIRVSFRQAHSPMNRQGRCGLLKYGSTDRVLRGVFVMLGRMNCFSSNSKVPHRHLERGSRRPFQTTPDREKAQHFPSKSSPDHYRSRTKYLVMPGSGPASAATLSDPVGHPEPYRPAQTAASPGMSDGTPFLRVAADNAATWSSSGHPDRREDGCHSKANCTSSGFESHSTGWEVSIWGIPTDTGMGR